MENTAKISMDNGNTYRNINELTDAEVRRVMDDINAARNIDEIAEACNKASGCGNTDREWLDAFMAELGRDYIIG